MAHRPILGVDLGHKPVADFKKIPPHVDDLTQVHLQAIIHPSQEGLQDDNQDPNDHPRTILDYILHPQHRPKHHRPDLIRTVGYTTNSEGRLITDPKY